jgi:cyclic-di-GMP phosphodiesterase, flagellum assembly factor TipF
MVRIIAICMVLIAACVSAVLYLRFRFSATDSALIALGLLSVFAIYNTIAGRKVDRAAVSDQMAHLARGSSDLARQVAEFGRRLAVMEGKVDSTISKALSTAQPLAAEIEELSRLVGQVAESVAQHDIALQSAVATPPPRAEAPATVAPPTAAKEADVPAPLAAIALKVAAFRGVDKEGIITVVRSAIEAQRIDLYLQPIVTLPQRKVRHYEAMSRLHADGGEIIAAAEFLPFAEAGALLPKLDNLMVLRCVQVVRRLLLKDRDVGLFCNLASAMLTDIGFPQLLELMEANRAIAPSFVFEFTQSAVRAMGPVEYESLAALAERGFRFSMDNLSDLRIEPRELTERGFRFIKVPAALLLNRVGGATANIHPADFSDLLGRFGIDLIAERIECETTVVDLLDYDVRFGQGFLFSPPRPVRAEALQGVAGDAKAEEPLTSAGAGAAGGLAQLARVRN